MKRVRELVRAVAPSTKAQLAKVQNMSKEQRLVAIARNRIMKKYFQPNKAVNGRFNQTHVGGEIKSLDVINATTPTANTQSALSLNITPQFVPLNLVTIGSSAWNRVGRKISMKSLRIRGFIGRTSNNVSTVPPQFSRMAVVYDKQPNGALPTISDLYLDQASQSGDSSFSGVTSGVNMNNRDRFEILWDWDASFPPCNTSTATQGVITATNDDYRLNTFIKLKNRETHYRADSATAVIGDIATGSLFLVGFGQLTAGTEPWNMNISARLRYSDL